VAATQRAIDLAKAVAAAAEDKLASKIVAIDVSEQLALFSDIVVHVQHEEERAYYQLERLWKDCPTIDLTP